MEIFKYQIRKIMSYCCRRPFIPPLNLGRVKPIEKRKCKAKGQKLFDSWLTGVHQFSSDDKEMDHQTLVREDIQTRVRSLAEYVYCGR